jgi:hypothetical protein
LPQWVATMIRAKQSDRKGPVVVLETIPKGSQHETLFKYASSLRGTGMKEQQILAALIIYSKSCQVVPPESHMAKLAKSVCDQYAAGPSGKFGGGGPDHSSSAAEPPPTEWPEDVEDAPAMDAVPLSHVPWPEPLCEFAYHGVLGDLLRAIEPHTEADIAAVAFQAIVMIGCILGRTAYFTVESTRHYCNEFVCLVGATAKGRKGSSFGQVRRVLRDVDAVWEKDRIRSGLSSGEGLIYYCRDAVKEMVKRRGSSKALEVTDPGEEDKRLLVVEEELASAIKTMSREGNTLSPVLRQAWDSPQRLAPMTKTSRTCATDPHISVIGHITRDELLKSLKLVENTNGFTNRFLWVCAKRSKSLPFGGTPDQQILADISKRIDFAIGWAQQNPSAIDFDSEAAQTWEVAYEELGDVPAGQIGGVLSRAEPHVRRIAMVYAVLDRSPVIKVEHLLAGLELWRYSRQSVEWIFSSVSGDDSRDKIEAAIRGAGQAGMTRSEIHTALNRKCKGSELDAHLQELLQSNRIQQRPEKRGRQTVSVFFRA